MIYNLPMSCEHCTKIAFFFCRGVNCVYEASTTSSVNKISFEKIKSRRNHATNAPGMESEEPIKKAGTGKAKGWKTNKWSLRIEENNKK